MCAVRSSSITFDGLISIQVCLTRACAWPSKYQRNSPDNIVGKLTVQSQPSWKRFNWLGYHRAEQTIYNLTPRPVLFRTHFHPSTTEENHTCVVSACWISGFLTRRTACNKSIARNRSSNDRPLYPANTVAPFFVLCFLFLVNCDGTSIFICSHTRQDRAMCFMYNVFVLIVNFFVIDWLTFWNRWRHRFATRKRTK